MPSDKPEWYYSVNGTSFGPVSWSELLRLAAAAKIRKTDMVRYTSWPSWVPADKPDLSPWDPLFPFASKEQVDYGYSLMAGGKHREAINWFQSLIDAAGIDAILAPESDYSRDKVYLFQAAAYYMAGEYDEALTGFTIVDDRHNPKFSYHKGFIYLCKKDYRGAIDQFKKALERQERWSRSMGGYSGLSPDQVAELSRAIAESERLVANAEKERTAAAWSLVQKITWGVAKRVAISLALAPLGLPGEILFQILPEVAREVWQEQQGR